MEATAPTRLDVPNFRSPKRILVRFLFLSRNLWKQKAQQRGKSIKTLHVRVRDLALSRDLWKTKVLRLQEQLRQVRDGSAELVAEASPLVAEPQELANPCRHDATSIPLLGAESLPPRDGCVSSAQESVHASPPRSAAAENPGEKKRPRR
jgi:hypothetical protein